jgi:hypothetical protein
MKKLLLPLVSAAALAVPASALAWGGGHDTHGEFHSGLAGATKLSGTGTSFAGTSATASGTAFTASLSTTWSSAQSKTFMGATVSCAPATASITIDSTATSYTGRTCSWTHDGTTKYGFMGKSSTGSRALLGESGTTVRGVVFHGVAHPMMGMDLGAFAAFHSGTCDHH